MSQAEQNKETALLTVENLNVYYGAIHALKGVSFHVDPGEIVCLIGANGAGKTTTLQTISGLLSPRSGSVTYDGVNLNKVPAHRILAMGMAQVPEGRRIFGQLTVDDNLSMGAYTVKDAAETRSRRKTAFERFPRLYERREQRAATLSGGEQQMLAIARAMMSKPRLLLLDEPSMGLSPVLTHEIFAIIREVAAEGTTVLLVEQNARMALKLADRAYVLETGQIVMAGDTVVLADDPRIQAAYLGG